MKKLWQGILFSALFVCSVAVAASGPDGMLRGVANKMISQLESSKGNLSRAKVHRIVNGTLVPHVDINRMAGMVVGRNYWRSSTRAQRVAFVNQFKRLVINTYAAALSSYNGDKVTVYPVRGGASGNFASVKSVIVRRSGQRIGINYNLINRGGRWKIYDFSIEGVSIVRNYQSQFSSTLASGGMNALIKRLKTYNRRT